MTESLLTFLIALAIILGTVVPYILHVKKKEAKARKKFREMQIVGLHEATTMHPHIDVTNCIGCGGCVQACPEGDVLGIIEGKATLIHGAKCVGHGLCADACPVGAIELLMASPGRSADVPILDEHYETNVKGIFIVGELGGIGLIRNAVNQAKAALEYIAKTIPSHRADYDVAIIGAGPAGLTSALAAKFHNLRYVILEQTNIGGAILHYPRAKVVMTSPVDLPLWGKLKLTEVKKEILLETWNKIIDHTGLEVAVEEKVNEVKKGPDHFILTTSKRTVSASSVVLALGRRGTPRKLGTAGEEQGKVMYRLIDASSYTNAAVLVVGGGDSAAEAAIGLSLQEGNTVTLSYRKEGLTRIKERNRMHFDDRIAKKKIAVVYQSEVKEIRESSVILSTLNGDIEIPNDYVFIFAGGELPFEFLRKIGIETHQHTIQ
jgi:thioredoxin reductase (NADPH)